MTPLWTAAAERLLATVQSPFHLAVFVEPFLEHVLTDGNGVIAISISRFLPMIA